MHDLASISAFRTAVCAFRNSIATSRIGTGLHVHFGLTQSAAACVDADPPVRFAAAYSTSAK